jgi:hypothetical protein
MNLVLLEMDELLLSGPGIPRTILLHSIAFPSLFFGLLEGTFLE